MSDTIPCVEIRDLKQHQGTEVRVRGWVYKARGKGKIRFIHFRDGTGIVQGVMSKASVDEAVFEAAGDLSQESSVIATGTVKLDERAPGGCELSLTHIELIQKAVDYPIALQEHGADFLLSNRHLWLRSSKPAAVLRIRATIVNAIRDYFDHQGYTNVDAPIFTPAACEGTTTLFEVKYFDDSAYLTQSGQLYMEAAAMALGKVYCFGPTFRAERSKTRKHLTEFWMVEPEAAFLQLDGVVELAEGLLVAIAKTVLKKNPDDLAILERDTSKLEKITGGFKRMHYDDAIKLLQDAGHDIEWGADFGAPDEEKLAEGEAQPICVTHWPAHIKAFYMKEDPSNPKYCLAVDVIAPEGYGELIGGAEREDDLAKLEAKIAEHELDPEVFSWYLDLRRYGSVPHGGFGLGLERTVAWICGTEHIRECIPFPRTIYRINP
jgi:asparaginyl-tRNA synthetase